MICFMEFDAIRTGGTRCPQRAERRLPVSQRVEDPPSPGFGGPRNALHRYVWALGLFLAALLCKTSGVMFPVVLLLYLWWRHGRITWRDGRNIAPFFILSLALGLTTGWFQRHHAIGDLDLPADGLGTRLVAAGLALGFYVRSCLWPVELMPLYPRWDLAAPSPFLILPWLCGAAFLVACWLRAAAWRRHALFGLGCFLACLLPVLGFVPMAYLRLSWVADHFAYLALIPFAGLAAAAVSAVADRTIVRFAAAGLIAFWAILTYRYTRIFRDPQALWTYAVDHNPESWFARNNLGSALLEANRLPEALAEFDAALRLQPAAAEIQVNRGSVLPEAGPRIEAIAAEEEALRALSPAWRPPTTISRTRSSPPSGPEALDPAAKAIA